EKISFEYDGLKQEIDTVYKVERDEAVEQKRTLEENIEDLQRRYDTEKRKNESYRQEKDEALNELTDLRVERESYKQVYREKEKKKEENKEEIKRRKNKEKKKKESYRQEKDEALNELTDLRVERESYKQVYREKEAEIRKLKRKLDNKERKIREVIKEKEELFSSRVDSEEHVVLSNELDKVRKEKESLEDYIAKLYVKHEQRRFEMESLQDEIHFLREGE